MHKTLNGPFHFLLLSLEGLQSNNDWPVAGHHPVIDRRPWPIVRGRKPDLCISQDYEHGVTVTNKNQLPSDLRKQTPA